ncbi:MAG TPA: VOC family protein, partial [Planctomycetaceae bacterium]
MQTEVSAPVRFHLSINVSNLEKSVSFFATLFGMKPAKQRDDYAKFELDEPPLVLSLEPHAPDGRGALNHAGFR